MNSTTNPAASEPPPAIHDDLPPRLSVSDEQRAAALAKVAAAKEALSKYPERLKKPGKPGRDGNKMNLVREQAADANLATLTVRNVANDPVEWLFNRGSLTPRQYEGALRIRSDAEAAEIGSSRARGTAVDRVSGGGRAGSITERQADAIRRKTLCLEKIGTISATLIRLVIIECRDLKSVGERMGMGPHYRVPRLAEALDAVADFYRL